MAETQLGGEFVGPEASVAENTGSLASAAAGTVAAPLLDAGRPRGRKRHRRPVVDRHGHLGWSLGEQHPVVRAGTNVPARGTREHLHFAALHVHPFAIAAYDRGLRERTSPMLWAGLTYGYYMMAATVTIRRFPEHRRALGVLTTLGAVALDRKARPSPPRAGSHRHSRRGCCSGHASAALWSDTALKATP